MTSGIPYRKNYGIQFGRIAMYEQLREFQNVMDELQSYDMEEEGLFLTYLDRRDIRRLHRTFGK